MAIIYLITNKVNGKVYVGQTVSKLAKRWQAHKAAANHIDNTRTPTYIRRAMAKHGVDSFSISVLEEVSELERNDAEKKWIAHFDSTDNSKGYNLTHGGDSPVITEGSRQRMSEARKGRFGGENHPRFGVKATDAQRKVLRDAHLGLQSGENHYRWGKKMPPEFGAKLSILMTGKLAGEKHPMWGKTHSDEAKKRISEKHNDPAFKEQQSIRLKAAWVKRKSKKAQMENNEQAA